MIFKTPIARPLCLLAFYTIFMGLFLLKYIGQIVSNPPESWPCVKECSDVSTTMIFIAFCKFFSCQY